MVTTNDTDICSDSNSTLAGCVLMTEECSTMVNMFVTLLNYIGLTGTMAQCPLEYFKCSGNLLILDKLVSGYYTGQKLPDGSPYDKPNKLGKCSHGGILDGSSFVAAEGGINKDSGYTVFSPHAHLHTEAARLAINHTKYFFDDIRRDIGDAEFDNFLKLSVDQETLNTISDVSCPSSMIKSDQIMCFVLLLVCYILS